MKIHPVPKKRNITFRYDIASALSQNLQKKLRRLPHIFAKVLELPFHSDADVLVQETSDSMRFVVTTDDDIGDDITAHPIEIYPGVTKIVVRGTNVLDLSMDELELDVWRFRLPAATRPELVSAAYIDGELVVTVPKGDNSDEEDGDNQEQILGEGNGRLVLVLDGLLKTRILTNWLCITSIVEILHTLHCASLTTAALDSLRILTWCMHKN